MFDDNGKQMKRSFQPLSLDVKTVCTRLMQVEVNARITYDELSELIGRRIENHHNILASARRILQRDHRIVFATERKQGLLRLDDTGIVNHCQTFVAKIRRTARRGGQQAIAAQYESLSDQLKMRCNTLISHFGLLHYLSGVSAQKKLENAVQKASISLPVAKTLEAFREE